MSSKDVITRQRMVVPTSKLLKILNVKDEACVTLSSPLDLNWTGSRKASFSLSNAKKSTENVRIFTGSSQIAVWCMRNEHMAKPLSAMAKAGYLS